MEKNGKKKGNTDDNMVYIAPSSYGQIGDNNNNKKNLYYGHGISSEIVSNDGDIPIIWFVYLLLLCFVFN